MGINLIRGLKETNKHDPPPKNQKGLNFFKVIKIQKGPTTYKVFSTPINLKKQLIKKKKHVYNHEKYPEGSNIWL